MKTTIFAALILMTSTALASDFSEEVCGPEYHTTRAIKDWYGDAKSLCRKVFCKNDSIELERESCLQPMKDTENIIVVKTGDNYRGNQSAGYKGKADFVYIEEGGMCFDDCKPVEEKKLFGKKVVSGFERSSCIECFKNRKGEYDNSFEYKEIGKRLYPNQKCYFACRDPKGPIVISRKLTAECEQCVGVNGHPGERFKYLSDKDGQCYVIDSTSRRWTVPYFFCGKNKDLLSTTFQLASSYNVRTIFFGEKPKCMEVDVATGGQIFSRVVGHSYCESENKDNSDRSFAPDKSNSGKSNSKTGSSATKQ